ncbi:cation transporter, partial [Streptomyces sp. NPDC059744]
MYSATEAEIPAAASSEAELVIGGMTCASCAARIEKKLNRMDGVTATVNYATEKARVEFGAGTRLDDVIATVEKTGYTAQPLQRPAPTPPASAVPPPATERTPPTDDTSPTEKAVTDAADTEDTV